MDRWKQQEAFAVKWVSASCAVIVFAIVTTLLSSFSTAFASTYVVYIPLDSPIYDELDALNGLGFLDTYLDEIKPISRVEAARLTLEAEANFAEGTAPPDGLARDLVRELRDQLHQEVQWLQANAEDNPPTMLQPADRLEAQYIYSRGGTQFWQTSTNNSSGLTAREGTPLLPNNDGIPTGSGSNEVVRWGAWGGAGGFLTAYGEGAVTGPFTYTPSGTSRIRALDAEAVLGLGNWAVSFGQEEMWWGTGHFGALSQSDNASPFPALRVQTIHPFLLPSVFRYLGQFRFQGFFGQLDGDRQFAHPWIDGQILSFKPLPNFEIGADHTIQFGGRGNNNYSWQGFIGKATGFNTGNAYVSNTHSRGGIFLKLRFPSLRGLVIYQEQLGEDNLTDEARPIGRLLPFLSVSYQGGFYLPRLTADGRTDCRFEYTITQPGYSSHGDSLYYSYNDNLMGDALGPNASELDFQFGRWFNTLTKGSLDLFLTDHAPKVLGNQFYPATIYGTGLSRERSIGFAFDLLSIPQKAYMRPDLLSFARGRVGLEYVNHLAYGPSNSIRAVVSLTLGLSPTGGRSLVWQ